MSVLVYTEHNEGRISKNSYEAVSYGVALARQINKDCGAAVFGNITKDQASVLAKYGVSPVYVLNHESLSRFANMAYASVISEIIRSISAETVIFPASAAGNILASRVAVKCGAALATDITEMAQISPHFSVNRSVYSGKANATVILESQIKILTIRPNTFPIKESPVELKIETPQVTVREEDFRAIAREIIQTSEKLSLTEADIVVSGGRGLKGPENFHLVENLAAELGAAVGASRAVVDAGWRPHSEQVGQTGKTVSPKMYIAIAISGAIQHLAGMSSSKVIVAINKDAEAPIFKVADYGILGDAFEVVPALTEAIKKYKNNHS